VLSQWLRNDSDSLSFRECVETLVDNPKFGIPSKRSRKPEKIEEREKAFQKISNLWQHIIEKHANSFWKALELKKDTDELYSKVFSAFVQLRLLNASENEPANFIAEIVNTLVPWKKTGTFLDEIDSWVEMSGELSSITRSGGVQLMTLQSAKGLEADIVCVVGLEEGILPKSNSSTEDIIEQSRLMFVSMTRAIEELHLFHARKRSGHIMFRSIYRGGKPDIQRSRFIDSIPDAYKEIEYHHP
jgi:superfamily I DNA/RNA helicase